jgi:hypothetical protein
MNFGQRVSSIELELVGLVDQVVVRLVMLCTTAGIDHGGCPLFDITSILRLVLVKMTISGSWAIIWLGVSIISSEAFVPSHKTTTTTTTSPLVLLASQKKYHVSQAIQDALAATEKYGAQSPEARVAWEMAEEIEDAEYSPCSKRCDYPIVKNDDDDDDDDRITGPSNVGDN